MTNKNSNMSDHENEQQRITLGRAGFLVRIIQQLDRVDSRNLLLPAADIVCGCRATRAAAPDICHAYACALLQLHVIVCLWSWAVCAWELGRQPPRSQYRQPRKGCYVVRSSDLVQNTNRSSSDYDTGASMIYQVLVHNNHPRGNSRCCRSYRSHPCATYLDHTDPTQANMCERSRSYRFHPGKHV